MFTYPFSIVSTSIQHFPFLLLLLDSEDCLFLISLIYQLVVNVDERLDEDYYLQNMGALMNEVMVLPIDLLDSL